MTDQEIRDWIGAIDCSEVFSPDDIRPLLKELLSYRALKFLPCWRVWCPDPNPSGWRAVAAFTDRETALWYRAQMQNTRTIGTTTEKQWRKALVLEGHEQPSETAR